MRPLTAGFLRLTSYSKDSVIDITQYLKCE